MGYVLGSFLVGLLLGAVSGDDLFVLFSPSMNLAIMLLSLMVLGGFRVRR